MTLTVVIVQTKVQWFGKVCVQLRWARQRSNRGRKLWNSWEKQETSLVSSSHHAVFKNKRVTDCLCMYINNVYQSHRFPCDFSMAALNLKLTTHLLLSRRVTTKLDRFKHKATETHQAGYNFCILHNSCFTCPVLLAPCTTAPWRYVAARRSSSPHRSFPTTAGRSPCCRRAGNWRWWCPTGRQRRAGWGQPCLLPLCWPVRWTGTPGSPWGNQRK